MIRPFTLVCMVMAGASGLYLYQAKHRSQLLDRDIAKSIKQTEQARKRIEMLQAEWALLNEPDRLAELTKTYLGLRTLQPAQFVALGDLAGRLPAPVAPAAPTAPTDLGPEQVPVAAAAAPLPVAARPTATPPAPVALAAAEPKQAAESKPARPAPESRPAPRPRPAPVELAAAPASRPVILAPITQVGVSSAATAPGTVGEAVLRAMRTNAARYAAPPAQPYVQPAYAPAATAPVYAGSLLGSARGALPPPVPFAGR